MPRQRDTECIGRDARRVQFTQQLEAVDVGHAQVDQHQLRCELARERTASRAW
jgi:hypothetical protein